MKYWYRCETCQSKATIHVKAIGCHFCKRCLRKIDKRIMQINDINDMKEKQHHKMTVTDPKWLHTPRVQAKRADASRKRIAEPDATRARDWLAERE